MSYKLSPYAKAVVAFIAGLVNVIAGYAVDGDFSIEDGINIVIWVLGTLGVYGVSNKPKP